MVRKALDLTRVSRLTQEGIERRHVRAWQEVGRLAGRLRTVGAARLAVFDGSSYFNRPGPRLVESLEMLVREATSIMPCG